MSIALCCAVLCCAVLCCAVPCRAVPCRAVLCCAAPCRAMLLLLHQMFSQIETCQQEQVEAASSCIRLLSCRVTRHMVKLCKQLFPCQHGMSNTCVEPDMHLYMCIHDVWLLNLKVYIHMLWTREFPCSLKSVLLARRYVQEVAEQHLVVQVSSAIKGRVSILDSADEPADITPLSQRFAEGQPIQYRVSQVCTW